MVFRILPVPSFGTFSIQWTQDSGRDQKRLWADYGWTPPGCSPRRALLSQPLAVSWSTVGGSCAASRQPAAGCWKPPNGSSHRSSGNGGRLQRAQINEWSEKGKEAGSVLSGLLVTGLGHWKESQNIELLCARPCSWHGKALAREPTHFLRMFCADGQTPNTSKSENEQYTFR
jgi:hypothetical protein